MKPSLFGFYLFVVAAAPALWLISLSGKEADLAGRFLFMISSIKSDICAQVLSHEMFSRNASTFLSHSEPSDLGRSFSAARINSSAVSVISTSFRSPYGRTTSLIEVEMTGLPAARYSGVLVGLMKRVDSLRANSNSAISQPAKYSGNSLYFLPPR